MRCRESIVLSRHLFLLAPSEREPMHIDFNLQLANYLSYNGLNIYENRTIF